MEHKQSFSIAQVNILYVVLLVAFIVIGTAMSKVGVIQQLLVTEFGIVFATSILYTWFLKKDFKHVFRLKKIPFSAVFKIVVLAVLMLPFIAIANMVTLYIISYFGKPIISGVPEAYNMKQFILYFLVIAGSAGLCEETLFRGVILNGYETTFGRKWGAIFSGLLFGLFHLNPQNLFGPIILGIMFSLLVQITGSIWAGVIAHTTNNGMAVLIGYLSNIGKTQMSMDSELIYMQTGVIIEAIVIYGIIGLFSYLGVRKILRSLKKQFDESKLEANSVETLSSETASVDTDSGSFQMSKFPFLTIGFTVCVYVFLVVSMYQ